MGYVEAVQSIEQLRETARALRGVPLATSILEGGGRMPWMHVKELDALGYSIIIILLLSYFRWPLIIQKAVENLKAPRWEHPSRSKRTRTRRPARVGRVRGHHDRKTRAAPPLKKPGNNMV